MMKTIEVEARGLTFTVDVAGPDDGEPVLLLHGFPQTRYAYRHELSALAEAGFRAAAPDQRGYSAGARPSGIQAYAVEHLVADALAIAESLGHRRFHLVGHDWGGQVAWCTAALHSDRVQTLTVLSRPHPAAFARAVANDPKQPDRSRHHRAFQKAEATDRLLADGAAALRAAFRDQDVPDQDAAAYLDTLSNRDALDAALNWYRAVGSGGLAAQDVPAVTVPTLYFWGDADATVGRTAAAATAEHVTAPYRFIELSGVGHFVTDQAPGVIEGELLSHLREVR